jgi:transcriptional regulator with XRE-family HTH domain
MTRLRLARLAVGWAQWRLARAANVSLHKISFAERGLVGVLSAADCRRLAAALGLDVHALFPDGGSAQEPTTPPALGDDPNSEMRRLPVLRP